MSGCGSVDSLSTYERGLEFNTASISASIVISSLKHIDAFPSTRLKHAFTDLISLSQKPPHHAARLAINFQVIPLLVKNSVSSDPLIDFHSSFRSLSALLKILALSE